MTWLAGRAATREAISPLPVYLDRSTSKSDRHQDFIQIPRNGCVFTQQEGSAFDMLLNQPPSARKVAREGGYGLSLFNLVKNGAQGAATPCGSNIYLSK